MPLACYSLFILTLISLKQRLPTGSVKETGAGHTIDHRCCGQTVEGIHNKPSVTLGRSRGLQGYSAPWHVQYEMHMYVQNQSFHEVPGNMGEHYLKLQIRSNLVLMHGSLLRIRQPFAVARFSRLPHSAVRSHMG